MSQEKQEQFVMIVILRCFLEYLYILLVPLISSLLTYLYLLVFSADFNSLSRYFLLL